MSCKTSFFTKRNPMNRHLSESASEDLYAVATHAPGPQGRLPLEADWLRETASGNVFGWTQNAAMGLAAGAPRQAGIPHPQHSRRHAGRRRLAGRARLPQRALGSRPPREGGRGRVPATQDDPVRGGRHRPVRRPHAGHARHVRQPAVPQRRLDGSAPTDAQPADARRGPGRRDLRQGPTRDDDGACQPSTTCRPCSYPAA
jgi:hypothetical protein